MIRSLKYYFKKKNEFHTGNLEPTYKNWDILECKDLYLSKVSDSQREQSSRVLTEKTIFHAYWHGTFGLKQAFSIKSFLRTQNLESKIKILPWNVEREIAGTPFLKIKDYINTTMNLAAKDDYFQIISLYKYGGLYFDLDVVFLKDFTPLLKGYEFVYAWECQPYGNSAILYLRKNSYITNYLAKKLLKRKAAMPWVLFDYKDKKLANLRNYPYTFFDPLWGRYCEGMPLSNFADFFKEFGDSSDEKNNINSYKEFFPGAFAYHWRNSWDTKEVENSYFGLFNREFNQILNNSKQYTNF